LAAEKYRELLRPAPVYRLPMRMIGWLSALAGSRSRGRECPLRIVTRPAATAGWCYVRCRKGRFSPCVARYLFASS